MGGTVLAVSSRALIEACEALGLEVAPLLAAAGIERSLLEDPDARLPAETVGTLWALAYQQSGDPHLALHAAEALPLGAYKVVDYLAWNAPTVGGAFAELARYFPLINSTVRLRLEVGTDVRILLESPYDPAALTRPYAEYALAAIFLRVRSAMRLSFTPRLVCFAFPPPDDTTEHERVFGCPVRFGAGENAVVFDAESWALVNEVADPGLFAVLEEHARLRVEKVSREAPAVTEVRRALMSELKGGNPSVAAVARRLAISPRTLQRRLQSQGLRFSDLLDSLREGAAKTYLADPRLAIAEVAYLLGFADQSSFHRAFKRWTGKTPNEYRKGR